MTDKILISSYITDEDLYSISSLHVERWEWRLVDVRDEFIFRVGVLEIELESIV